MGRFWLPDPPIGHQLPSDISVPPVFITDSEDDEIETVQLSELEVENNGYMLLTDSDNQLELENEEADFNLSSLNNIEQDQHENAEDLSDHNSLDNSESIPCTHRDIVVNFDEVREAMAHITLPASATPSWASAIPDSEWCSFLQNRIHSLQEQNSSSTSSQNLNAH